MARNLNEKCKQCRREGKKLFLKGDKCSSSKCPLIKRNYPPGMHGVKGQPRLTGYGIQLREKQQAKRMYGLLERQFRNYCKKAVTTKGVTGDNLLRLLETRLDNVIYRLGLAKSRNLARQLVAHAHFTVNNKRADIPSFSVRTGDVIKVKENSKKKNIFAETIKNIKPENIPDWLSWDDKEASAKVVKDPVDDKLRGIINTKMIIEFYSR
ncbi:MAG: 30S ribosomal protein S4 [Patescibacteria group bacterium]|nr:30S ribosomal protein S4 [Patescibacteria group bacterium]MDD5490500.1 30S ribosomal protein S4 [Patescibacteria group bacterium]